ncbi:Alpha-glucosidase 2 [Gracilariopsis chorda]|uniref:Alpha-glucosidase 2 n=2 Tax=Gracilariopsis TaxID=2781 RepID=A0A2V3IN59_9FLOR|nr:Alpha-glucosidase 2 [Gracilariopsis chorda]|eukprot:PXF43515.1 Alpha-glucosidase 2 [Gracilariopsis chorda]
MFPGHLAFVAPCTLGTSNFKGATLQTENVRFSLPPVSSSVRSKKHLQVSMTTLFGRPTKPKQKVGEVDNPDNVDYKVYDYIPVGQFTPLSNTNWYAAGSSTPGSIEDWTATMNVKFDRIDDPFNHTATHPVQIQVTSYENNSFRVRFNPDGPIRDLSRGPIQKQQMDWIRNKEVKAGCDPKMKFTSEGFLQFEMKNLNVIIYGNFKMRVTRKRDQKIIMENDEVPGPGSSGNKCRGLMYVDRKYGTAVATVRRNFRVDSTRKEAFYGAGQINAQYNNELYFLERTGLAMTSYNYDNLNYNQPDLIPPGHDSDPDYYIPMYFAAPWVIAHGYRGTGDQYSYGWFFDNVSQSYTNTGDDTWAGQKDLAYMGAQCGPFDQHFVYGGGDGLEDVVTAFSYLQGKEYESQGLNIRSAMPPKYVFGFFQGVFGATSLLKDNLPNGQNNISLQEIVEGYQNKNVPFEGLAVDVDMQDNLRVFTTRPEFWTACKVGDGGDPNNKSVFEWAHDKGLVCQTNITCFLRNDNGNVSYDVNQSLREKKLYTKNNSLTGSDFGTTTDGPSDAYIGHLDYGGGVECDAIFPDWGRPDVAQWWGDNYRKLFSIGLDFVWQDMTVPAMMPHKLGDAVNTRPPGDWPNAGDPSNGRYNWKSYHPQVLVTDMRYEDHGREPFVTQRNLHAYTLCESTRKEGIVGNADSLTKFRRSYIISRGGYIGNQHFGGMWVGDNSSTEDYLAMMIINVINMNMSGVPLVGSDIGGFTEHDKRNPCTPDLMMRFVQAGCLLPWFRNHYDRWIESKQHGKNYQELYMYPDQLDGLRSFVELRYRWQEVLYTAMYQNALSGKPIIKTISMYGNDVNVKDAQNDHFLLGGHDGYRILCAPVVKENRTSRDVYLPALTKWIKYGPAFEAKPLERAINGGQWMRNYSVPQNEMALFVREGTILPVRYTLSGNNKSLNTYTQNDPLVFEVFTMSGGNGMMYLDDGGVTTNAEDNGKYSVINVESKKTSSSSGTITFSHDLYEYPWGASFYGRVRSIGPIKTIHVKAFAGEDDMVAGTFSSKQEFFNSATVGTYWEDKGTGSVWFRLPAVCLADSIITVNCNGSIVS